MNNHNSFLFFSSEILFTASLKVFKILTLPPFFLTELYKSEGFGTTYIGSSGVNAIVDIAKESRKKIAIWGDSYIQAYQVNDSDKIPQVVTAKLLDNGFFASSSQLTILF